MLVFYDCVFCVLGRFKKPCHLGVSSALHGSWDIDCISLLLEDSTPLFWRWLFQGLCPSSEFCSVDRCQVSSGCHLTYRWLSLILSRLILNSCCLRSANKEWHLGVLVKYSRIFNKASPLGHQNCLRLCGIGSSHRPQACRDSGQHTPLHFIQEHLRTLRLWGAQCRSLSNSSVLCP